MEPRYDSLKLFHYSTNLYFLQRLFRLLIRIPSNTLQVCTIVVPGDFTHSGKLDLLVMSQSGTYNQLSLTLYSSIVGDGFGMSRMRFQCHHYSFLLDTNNPLTLPSSAMTQPIPLDIDGDMKIDLLGMTPGSSGSSSSPFQVWQNTWNNTATESTMFRLYVLPLSSMEQLIYFILSSEDAPFRGQQCTLANPHSNAVVDLDGDCLAGMSIL